MHATRRQANEKHKERERDGREDARDTKFTKVSMIQSQKRRMRRG